VAMGLLGGIALGAGFRFEESAHAEANEIRAAYTSGQVDGVRNMEKEAVRKGHGFWERSGGGVGENSFAWLPSHVHWTPDRPRTLPIDRVLEQ